MYRICPTTLFTNLHFSRHSQRRSNGYESTLVGLYNSIQSIGSSIPCLAIKNVQAYITSSTLLCKLEQMWEGKKKNFFLKHFGLMKIFSFSLFNKTLYNSLLTSLTILVLPLERGKISERIPIIKHVKTSDTKNIFQNNNTSNIEKLCFILFNSS